ncbi:VOC family protein [Streptomyces sp. NPDC054784]
MAIATLDNAVLDCPDPAALARFYAAVLGGEVRGEGRWVEAQLPDGQRLAFQEAPDFVPPRWPGAEHPQQMHLDLNVERDRMDAAERGVLALGARLAQDDGDGRRDFRVYLDPAGHPFCLCAV